MKPIYKEELYNGTTPGINQSYWNQIFDELIKLDWLEETPNRKEYMMSENEISYTYGVESRARTYTSKPFHNEVKSIMNRMNYNDNTQYNVCFLNRYDDQHQSLGWHTDNFPKMDQGHPIAVVSLGSEREIWWKEKDFKGIIPSENRQLLRNGSLFIMPAGFQQTHFHRIPKSDKPVGTRISLTFRKFL